MAISPTDIQILFTNYDITAHFLNLASCSEHFISIKHRILATFNIKKKKKNLSYCMPLSLPILYVSCRRSPPQKKGIQESKQKAMKRCNHSLEGDKK
jgi:hypothetical protein